MTEPTTEVAALDVVRRGVARTPEIRRPVVYAFLLAVSVAGGRLAVPVLVQQVLDRGLLGPAGYRPSVVWTVAGIAAGVIVVVAAIAPLAQAAMAEHANRALLSLRRQAFGHVHRLGIMALSEERQGSLLTRVTTDVDAISHFVEWGAVQWAINTVLIAGALGVMAFYSWPLALLVLVCLGAAVPVLLAMQRRQLQAYAQVRERVGELSGTVDEMLAGAATVRTYGFQPEAERRLDAAVDARYRADVNTAKNYAVLFTVGDLAGAIAIAAVVLVARHWGADLGLEAGEVVSFFFLVTLIQGPIGELTEVLDNTQTAVAGWDRVLRLLATEPEIAEPDPGVDLPAGAVGIRFVGVDAGYGGALALRGVDVDIAPGTKVAVVGETGSGKTTFARILCRLLDPVAGTVWLSGVDLRTVAPDARHRAVRLVPQDGFLFDTTIADNIRLGRPGVSDDEVGAAVDVLGLGDWVAGLPAGLDTPVGPRGEQLSVGERQLVALLRAQVSGPGLLVLDEATSSVDPRTEASLAVALDQVAAGRTLVSIAHRISTAERADLVLVFDRGRLVEVGPPAELAATTDGRYARLVAAWRRNVELGADRPGSPDSQKATARGRLGGSTH